MNLVKPCDDGIKKNMRQAARSSGGMDSSNPRHWGASGSTTMVMVFVVLFVLFVQSCLFIITHCMKKSIM